MITDNNHINHKIKGKPLPYQIGYVIGCVLLAAISLLMVYGFIMCFLVIKLLYWLF